MPAKHTLIKVLSPMVLRLQLALHLPARTRLLVLYLHADATRYPKSYDHLRSLLASCGESYVIKIDNFAPPSEAKIIDNSTVGIAGDNSFWEFSGWRKGLEYAKRNLAPDFTHVLFVNDAFLNKSKQGNDLSYYRRLFNRITLSRIGSDVLGDVSSAPGRHLIRGYQVNRWIKSSIYCMSYATALRLPLNNLNEALLEELIPSSYRPGPLLNPHPMLNDEFRVFVEEWLTKRWQWKVSPSSQTWPLLRGKTAAIINERLLTADLEQLGCRLLTGQAGRPLGARRIAPAPI